MHKEKDHGESGADRKPDARRRGKPRAATKLRRSWEQMAERSHGLGGTLELGGATGLHVFATLQALSAGQPLSPEKRAMFGQIDAEDYLRLSTPPKEIT